MMEYIEKVLGISVRYKVWRGEAEMPYYIRDRFGIREAELSGVRALFLYPRGELSHIRSLKKQLYRVQRTEELPIVLIMDSISREQREVLIRARIPFAVPEKQLYLPFMGTVLQERCLGEIKKSNRFQPAAQVLFFYYLYAGKTSLYVSEAASELGFSPMTASRAAVQLTETGLFRADKDGVRKRITGVASGRQLYGQAQPYLMNPVQKRLFVQKSDVTKELLLSGESALSLFGECKAPVTECFAAADKNIKGIDHLLDCDRQIQVQIWKYNPALLAKGKTVDLLSLVQTLQDCKDDSVLEAAEGLLEELWKGSCRLS